MPAAEFLEKAPSVDEVLREVSRIRTVVAEAVEEGVKTAVNAIKQGRATAEDVLDETKHRIKRNPMEAMGVVFAAGVLTGAMITWACRRR